MIELIYGSKGTGKTKIIIDKANDNVETAKGVRGAVRVTEIGNEFAVVCSGGSTELYARE